MSVFEVVGKLVEWFGQFFPRWEIVDTTHAGVKFVGGKRPLAKGPGIVFYWPARTTFYTYPTAIQAERLEPQTITTTDDKTIAVGGMIVYEVTDILPLLAHTHQPDETIRFLTLGVIHDVCAQRSWQELREQQTSGALDRALRAEARAALRPYGVKVQKVTLTDLTLQPFVIKLLQADSKAPLAV